MTDDLQRRITDLEKRVQRLERMQDKPAVHVTVATPWCDTCEKPKSQPCGLTGCQNARYWAAMHTRDT